MPLGLADDRVVILDPACGTGTFLYEVIRLIYDRISPRGAAAWRETARKLIKRLYGFELLMAPYTICHLKLEELFKEFGYTLGDEERLGVYLTNTLEDIDRKEHRLAYPGLEQAITTERKLADEVKANEPVMVVLGNPPYSGLSANMNKWIDDLLKKPYELPLGGFRQSYYEIDGQPLGEKKVWLQDDYVKFLRWAQMRIDTTTAGKGLVGMITNHGYLDNPTFRGMRQSLMASFNAIYILDLHGNIKKREQCPDGSKDENVFDIQQGVAIGLFTRNAKNQVIKHGEMFGLRLDKYRQLSEVDCFLVENEQLEPKSPYYFFKPSEETNKEEYEKGISIQDIMPLNVTGIITARDGFVIAFKDDEIERRINIFLDKNRSDSEVKQELKLNENYAWRVSDARKELSKVDNLKGYLKSVLYRPFDERRILYHSSVTWRTREKVMRHMLAGENLGLITPRSTHELSIGFATDIIIAHKALDAYDINYIFPLYLYPEEGQRLFADGAARHPNISPEFIKQLETCLNIKFNPVGASCRMPLPSESAPPLPSPSTGREEYPTSVTSPPSDITPTFASSVPPLTGGLQGGIIPLTGGPQGGEFSPEDVFFYIYSVLHAPTYRTRYAEFLRIDFPRIPLPPNPALFFTLGKWGAELVRLHLLRDSSNWDWEGISVKGDNPTVGKVDYSPATEEIILDISKPMDDQLRIGPVPLHIWEFQIGGYQVLRHWLTERKGRKIELGEFVPIIIALKHTDRIMREEIDPLFGQLLEKVGQGA